MDKKHETKEELLAAKVKIEKALGIVSNTTEKHGQEHHTAKFPNYGDDTAINPDDNSPTEVADFAENIEATSELEAELDRINAALAEIDAGKNK